jgi:hypothetical protein
MTVKHTPGPWLTNHFGTQVLTGDSWNAICELKGDARWDPDDCAAITRKWIDEMDGDGHSHSYFTVSELMAYDWTQTTTKQGDVDPIEWARFRDHGKPDSWSGMVSGGSVSHHTPEEFEEAWQKVRNFKGYPVERHASAHLTAHNSDRNDLAKFIEALGGGTSPYATITWTTSYLDAAEHFLGRTLPRLWRKGGPDDVRIVFFFDN